MNTKKPAEPVTSFTVDSDTTSISDVPTITRLLNRKKLLNSNTSENEQPKLADSSPIELISPKNEPNPDQPTPPEATLITLSASSAPDFNERDLSQKKTPALRIQTTRRPVERRTASRLTLWNVQQLQNGTDPLGKGLALLLNKGAKFSLFLTIVATPSGNAVPHFIASAALAPQAQLQLWSGLKWDPTVMPEVWNLFVRTGYAELAPPGAATNIKSNRNVVRGAFGVSANEWLLLVRIGPANACRGVLALVSDKSLSTELAQALPLLSAPAPVAKKSA